MSATIINTHVNPRRPAIAPHLVFFWLFNGIYFLPLLFIYLSGYVDEGAADAIGLLDSRTLNAMTTIYAEGLFAFTLGSIAVSWVVKKTTPHGIPADIPQVEYGTAETVFIWVCIASFACAKAALVPLGVYHAYAAESGEMSGGIWSTSMVLSECLLLASILTLNSDTPRNVTKFVLLSALNCVNLLHGTRIMFIVNVMAYVFYTYSRGTLTLKRILILGPIFFSGVVVLAYIVFLSRSGASIKDDLSLGRAISPIIYESVFSQLSLGTVVASPDITNSPGALPNFLADIIIFTAPRFIVPDKDAVTYIHDFAYMSPLGAFNGYAAGLIYFGVFWPIFYAILGGAASWLHFKARSSPYLWVFYTYFTADVLFRFMRDGYLIPVKIFGDMLVVLALLFMFKALIRGITRQRATTEKTVLEKSA